MLAQRLLSLGHRVVDLFYPPHCVLCLAPAPRGEPLCAGCLTQVPRLCQPTCPVCGREAGTDACPCYQCRARPPAYTCAAVLYRFEGPVKDLIHRFKYEHQYHLRHRLATWLAQAWADPRVSTNPRPDALVPVPLHPTRQRERGFNQARVLAQLLSRETGVPVLEPLRRVRRTPSQTTLSREMRMENLRNAFALAHNTPVRQLHLLLIDDVLTTGSTVHECARVLLQGGAASVRVAVVARR